MSTTHSAVLANAGAVTLVMPVLAPESSSPMRALTVVLQAPPVLRLVPDHGFRASRDGALDAAAELLAEWRPTRIAVDTTLRAPLVGDAAQLASLVAIRLGHRRLWNATVSRELDEPGLFRKAAGDVDAGLAADWYARHIILSTESDAEADDRLLVVTVADDGPLLRAMRTPPRRRTTQPARPRARHSRARRALP